MAMANLADPDQKKQSDQGLPCSDQGLPCLLFWEAFCKISSHDKRKVLKILENLPYMADISKQWLIYEKILFEK